MAAVLTLPNTGSLLTCAVSLLQVATGVDLNTLTEQALYYVPAGLSCIPVYFVVKNASISLTTASFGFGFNAATDNDVVASATHTSLTAATLSEIISAKVGAKIGVGNNQDVLRLKCSVSQGAPATADVYVFGFLF